MKHVPVKLPNGEEVYICNVPESVTEGPMNPYEEIILMLGEEIERLNTKMEDHS